MYHIAVERLGGISGIDHVLVPDVALSYVWPGPAANRRSQPLAIAVHGERMPGRFHQYPRLSSRFQLCPTLPRQRGYEQFGAVEFCIGATLVGSSDGTFGILCCFGIYAVGGLFE